MIASRPVAPASVAGSLGSRPYSREPTHLPAAMASATQRQPDRNVKARIGEHHSKHATPRGAQRQPDADLVRATGDRVQHQAVQPDRRDEPRQQAERRGEHRHQPLSQE